MSGGAPRTRAHSRIEALTRPDKWYLGGLDGVVWAPPFPRWLDQPGFWDAAHLLNLAVEPCFAVAMLDGEGREIPLSAVSSGGPSGRAGPAGEWKRRGSTSRPARRWRPGALTVHWRGAGEVTAVEDRRVLPGGLLESSWTLEGLGTAPRSGDGSGIEGRAGIEDRASIEQPPAPALLVAFTAQPAGRVGSLRRCAGGMAWVRTVTDRAGRELKVEVELRGPEEPEWRRALPSEGAATPVWALSPFAEGGPRGVADPLPCDEVGWIWIAAAFSVRPGDGAPVALRMRLAPRLPDAGGTIGGDGGGDYGHGDGGDGDGGGCDGRDGGDGGGHGRDRDDGDGRRDGGDRRGVERIDWPSFFAGFPAFACGDPHLDRYFDHRIHGLGLNRIEGRWGNVRHPCIAEGPEYFHVPITYSAQCHMMEMRWRAGGREAWGSLLNFLDNQREDGSLHGRLYAGHLEGTDFYHANWGDALLAVEDMHPDRSSDRRTLTLCYEGLARYARWLCAARDPEGSGMFNVLNHFETGQEYMSRYMAVDDEADVSGWRPRLRLKGIDVTVYAHQLHRALGELAGRLGRSGDASEWRVVRDRCADAIRRQMWCPVAQLFTDVDGRTGERTGVKAAVGFYPMLTGLVGGARLDAMLDHLEDPSTFGTPFPLPSSSVDDPRFSAEGVWRGKRRNCPWNGRVWPMTTSHVIEGLLRCWRGGSERAGALAAELLPRFVRMMFTGGHPDRPNCFEHYNPYTGRACHFRGIDDYQHSWVLDLLARGIAGLNVDAEGIEVRPLPHDFEHVSLGPVAARGREVSVALDGARATVTVDGRRFGGTRDGGLRVEWARARV